MYAQSCSRSVGIEWRDVPAISYSDSAADCQPDADRSRRRSWRCAPGRVSSAGSNRTILVGDRPDGWRSAGGNYSVCLSSAYGSERLSLRAADFSCENLHSQFPDEKETQAASRHPRGRKRIFMARRHAAGVRPVQSTFARFRTRISRRAGNQITVRQQERREN